MPSSVISINEEQPPKRQKKRKPWNIPSPKMGEIKTILAFQGFFGFLRKTSF
jgi:hypothetical protein